ncbi:MAG: hypothetical protein LBI29_04070 [Rickettsiales bacterium]|jgi:uncharacterized membrane protein|nr:hypothetical protein [Rickettsiales bacterium]
MKTYGVFVRKNIKTGALEKVILLANGFNVYAAVFSLFWFLANGLWHVALLSGLFLGMIILIPPVLGFFILLSLVLLAGFFANGMLAHSLDRRGNYYFAGLASGIDRQDARKKFLEEINEKYREKNQVIY